MTHDDHEVSLARRFLSDCCKMHTGINQKITTYTLKHVAEAWTGGYISHESFLTAARDAGYKYEPVNGQASGYLNIKVMISAMEKYHPGSWRSIGGWV